MLCRKVIVKKLHMSKPEAILYRHAKTAALQQMQASHKSVCQLSKLPCSVQTALFCKQICSAVSFGWQRVALTPQIAKKQPLSKVRSNSQRYMRLKFSSHSPSLLAYSGES